MELIQGYVRKLQAMGHHAKLILGSGKEVIRRLLEIGKRRWDAYQARKYPPNLRTEFKPHLMKLPEVDLTGSTMYLLGW
jgi:hypothetical protein